MMEDVLEHGNNKLPVQSWRVSTDEMDLRRKLISIREQSIANLVVVCEAETTSRIFDIVSVYLGAAPFDFPFHPREIYLNKNKRKCFQDAVSMM